jgi:hypothetical protein
MVELWDVISIILFTIMLGTTCHKTDLPEPAVMTYQASLKMEGDVTKHTDSIEPDEGIQITLPLFEFLAPDKPLAGGRLSLLASIIMIRGRVRRRQPIVDLLPKFVCEWNVS